MKINYLEYGDKSAPVIIFIHGGGVSGWMWDQQVAYFSSYHCIVPDLPEHGRADNNEPFSIRTSAENLISLIKEKANGKKVYVIGFSLGAQVLIQMLSIKPDLVEAAIINSALVRPNRAMTMWMTPLIKLSYPLIKWRSFSKLQARTLYISDSYFEKYYKESRQIKRETLLRVLMENMSFPIPDTFCKVRARILITVGQKENNMMKKSAIDLVKANPNCTGIVLENAGHGVSLANPVFFNNLAESWLEKNSLPDAKGRFKEIMQLFHKNMEQAVRKMMHNGQKPKRLHFYSFCYIIRANVPVCPSHKCAYPHKIN
ncbi:alpha/beta hydrolase [Gracilibacillus oryzae]|uniref:Alpha/beta hydrolase n=1 Tax=Gracilibacillus oryzae TaxID=1672701 RepID=A0A7C8KV25_9BACI|nr:alpha/beta hydrolase [Gracilibacillus oryzae]